VAAKITTFLMFDGRAGEALEFYTSLFSGGQVTGLFDQDNATQAQSALVSRRHDHGSRIGARLARYVVVNNRGN